MAYFMNSVTRSKSVWLQRLACLAIVICSTCTVFAQDKSAASAEWIWHDSQSAPSGEVEFEKSFLVPKQVTSAQLRFLGESVHSKLRFDGELIAVREPYDELVQIDFTDRLSPGRHTLTIQSQAVDGPSAVFLLLEFSTSDKALSVVQSDETWKVKVGEKPLKALSRGAVGDRIIIARENQIGIRATENYEQWKTALKTAPGTDFAKFSVRPGFELQMVRAAKPNEGSWVSMAIDRDGKLIIAREDRGLLRMELSSDGDEVIDSELIEDTLRECRGILPIGRHIYVNANNSKGLFRLTEKANGVFDKPSLIYASSGSVGHGRNDLALGPDGKIYSIHGDAVRLPEQSTDWTSPYRDARNGKKTSEGHLLRIDQATGAVELLAAGLRNPFGIDFNARGDCFTYDADAEHDMGSPWYRPTRVSHLVAGGDYGWRGVTKSWPPYFPDQADAAPPNMNIGKGSPTAVKFGTNSNFPVRFKQAAFILDWAYGRILAVHAIPRGSSYLTTAESFLQGRPLNVTDLDFGKDGSMYFITGGRKTKSALYRVKYMGEDSPSELPRMTRQQRERASFANESRRYRIELESKILQSGEIHTALADVDPWIGHAAVQLANRAADDLVIRRANESSNLYEVSRLLLSLSRSDANSYRQSIVDQLNKTDFLHAPKSTRHRLLQAYRLCLDDSSSLSEKLLLAAQDKLSPMYPDFDFDCNRLLAEVLVGLKDEAVVSKTMQLHQSMTSQRWRMLCLYVIRNATTGWTPKLRRQYFGQLNQTDTYTGGAGMASFISTIRDDAISQLSKEQKNTLRDVIQPQDMVVTDEPEPARPFVKKWTVGDLADLPKRNQPSSIDRGKKVFRSALCANCHRAGGIGRLIGPDLTGVSRRFGRSDLLNSIVHPSNVIADKYRSLKIITDDGKMLTGQVVTSGDYRSPTIRLATDPNQPTKATVIAKKSISRQEASDVSWMPTGLLDTFNKDEIADLLSFIESAGQRQ